MNLQRRYNSVSDIFLRSLQKYIASANGGYVFSGVGLIVC